jgi:hypothetical protein
MTKKEAKELTLELWTYLAKHPECWKKSQVPEELYSKIEKLRDECPLCHVFFCCDNCLLEAAGLGCGNNSPYRRWAYSAFSDTETRRKAAKQIVDTVAAWEPGE